MNTKSPPSLRCLWSITALLWLSFLLVGKAQPADSLWQITFQKDSIVTFAVDPLQQLLAVDHQGVLTQYSPQGKALFQFHNTTLGEDFTIDATDPFNILLFYQEQQTIVLLDRTLSERATLDLRDTPVQYATAVARSHDNNLWVYDEWAGRLYRLSARGELLFTSNDFRLSEDLTDGPTQILRWGDRLALNFPQRGIALFSILGQLEAWWEITEVEDCFFQQQQLYFRQNGDYYRYFPQQQVTQILEWPEPTKQPTFYREQLDRRYLLFADGTLVVESRVGF
ncbi:hypothetical protein [Lewinella sp. LCG006]|uniref:hypothetical protein n=1 Tax=Lewinella sp. LCG006 TaxID=3231911 RepID=UPI00345F87A0